MSFGGKRGLITMFNFGKKKEGRDMTPKPLHEAVKEFKERNGNNNYTQKDLIIYLLHRVDNIDNRLAEGSQKFISKDTFLKILLFACAIVGGAVGYCFKLIIDIIKIIGG